MSNLLVFGFCRRLQSCSAEPSKISRHSVIQSLHAANASQQLTHRRAFLLEGFRKTSQILLQVGALWCFQMLVLVCCPPLPTPSSTFPRPRRAFAILFPSLPSQRQERLLCDFRPVCRSHSCLLNMKDQSAGRGVGCTITQGVGGKYEDEHAGSHQMTSPPLSLSPSVRSLFFFSPQQPHLACNV